MELIYEKSRAGRRACSVAASDVPETPIEQVIDGTLLRQDLDLPEVAEIDLVRHYMGLSRRNFGVDIGFYPLGSCTMKYNPKVNEDVARLEGFTALHPYAPEAFCQGNLKLMYDLRAHLSEIFGMADFTLQPAAGAHGELTGVMIIKKYFDRKAQRRSRVLIPDTAHGTNPASVALCGFQVATLLFTIGMAISVTAEQLRDARHVDTRFRVRTHKQDSPCALDMIHCPPVRRRGGWRISFGFRMISGRGLSHSCPATRGGCRGWMTVGS